MNPDEAPLHLRGSVLRGNGNGLQVCAHHLSPKGRASTSKLHAE